MLLHFFIRSTTVDLDDYELKDGSELYKQNWCLFAVDKKVVEEVGLKYGNGYSPVFFLNIFFFFFFCDRSLIVIFKLVLGACCYFHCSDCWFDPDDISFSWSCRKTKNPQYLVFMCELFTFIFNLGCMDKHVCDY
jgi:hypothetical protein